MRAILRTVWRWFVPLVDGERLLRAARREFVGDQEVLLFDRCLTKEEADAARAAWERQCHYVIRRPE